MSVKGSFAVNTKTFSVIQNRFSRMTPQINLSDHIVDNPGITDLEAYPLTLQGIDFNVKDADKFLAALRGARFGNEAVFKEGSTKPSDWKDHWAMTASLLATKGIGFREPWREAENDRMMRMRTAQPPNSGAPEMDSNFAGNFAAARSLDLTALHVAVAFGKWTRCNIHIDETGIAMATGNNLTITPNVISHFFNELGLKTILGENLPTWFLDRFNLHVLSPEMGYRRIGVTADIVKGENYKVTVSASCALTSCPNINYSKLIKLDTSALKQINPTINITGTHDIFGGGR